MKIWGLAVALLVSAVCAPAQHDQPGAPSPAAQSGMPAAGDEAKQETKPEVSSKLDLTPDAQGKLSQQQMQELFRVVADKDMQNDKRLHDYTYVERDVEHRLDGKGNTKSTEIKTYDVLEVYGEQVQRLTEKDDKPLSPKDATKEEEKIQKIIDKRKNESDEDRKKREQRAEKDREDGRKFTTEVADAYNFKLVGTEQINGRDAWVIDGEPRPGFEPKMKEAKFLPKFHGRVWIDKDDEQLVKMDIEAIDTVSFGWFLARVHKGTRVTFEQVRVNDEVWLPQHVAFKVDVRVALLKNFNIDGEQTFRDYKKFRTSTKILGMTEVKDDVKDAK
jgi:hypothetical protein